MLQNDPLGSLVAKFHFAENELSEGKIQTIFGDFGELVMK